MTFKELGLEYLKKNNSYLNTITAEPTRTFAFVGIFKKEQELFKRAN